MKNKNVKKLFSSTLIFILFISIFANASAQDSEKFESVEEKIHETGEKIDKKIDPNSQEKEKTNDIQISSKNVESVKKQQTEIETENSDCDLIIETKETIDFANNEVELNEPANDDPIDTEKEENEQLETTIEDVDEVETEDNNNGNNFQSIGGSGQNTEFEIITSYQENQQQLINYYESYGQLQAVIQASKLEACVGETIVFDGSQSGLTDSYIQIFRSELSVSTYNLNQVDLMGVQTPQISSDENDLIRSYDLDQEDIIHDEDVDSTITFNWDFGDEQEDVGEVVSHSYSEIGQYEVVLTVYCNGQQDSDSVTIDIITDDEQPPSKVTGLDYTDQKDGEIRLAWEPAEDNEGIDHYNIYRKIYGEDCNFIDDTSNLYYSDSDLDIGISYVYQVSAVDFAGNEGPKSDEKECTSFRSNNAPIADLSAGEPYFQWTDPIQFDASNSYDPDNDEIQYRWDFKNDGEFDTDWKDSPIITHNYNQPGNYEARLQVKDIFGEKDDDTTIITVVIDSPKANAGGPYEGFEGELINFDGSKSYDPEGRITNYTWDFGDGEVGYGISLNHFYEKNGTYFVTLSIKYNGGSDSNFTVATILKKAGPKISKPHVEYGEETQGKYVFTAISDHIDDMDISIIFDWGDGMITTTPYFQSETIVSASHKFSQPGEYTVKVYAKDLNGEESEIEEITISIEGHVENDSKKGSNEQPIIQTIPLELIGIIALAVIIIESILFVIRKKKNNK